MQAATRLLRLLKVGLAAFLWVWCPQTAAGSTPFVIGVGDQSPAFLDDPRFTGLNTGAVRVVIPWNALADGAAGAASKAWLSRAALQHLPVLVALDHSAGEDCRSTSPCVGPRPNDYADQFAALVQAYPWVESWVPWNEPNHASQPTRGDPGLAAAYYNAARQTCTACKLVAGDLLDGDNFMEYWRRYAADLNETPMTIGLHDYFDATYFQSSGADAMLAANPAASLWLSEVGGIVRFSPDGLPGLPYNEARAADSVRWTLAMPFQKPRIARVYLYQWQSSAAAEFDSGLMGYDGAPRPGYGVLAGVAGVRANAIPAETAAVAQAVALVSSGRDPAAALSVAATGHPKPATSARATAVLRTAGRRAILRARTVHFSVACVSSAGCRAGVSLPPTRGTAVVNVRPFSSLRLQRQVSPVRAERLGHERAVRVRICLTGQPCRSTLVPLRTAR